MTYSVNNGMVIRDDGYVALQHRNSNGAMARIGDIVYTWSPKNNISLCWVHPDHVTKLLNERANICCGQTSNKFLMASYTNVNLWAFGTRDYQGE
jgi:hypothetical protein